MTTLLAAHGPSAYWYLTRGSGVVSLLLLTGAMLAGVASSTRWSARRWPRFVVSGLHRNLTLVALGFVVVHVLTTVADGFAPIGLLDGVVPFRSPYRPLWLGLGTVAFDLLLALVVTSLLRARVGLRLWRGLHWLAYASWPVALLHSLGSGSDARTGWLELLALACVAAVALAVLWRAAAARSSAAARTAAVVAAGVLSLVLVGWYRSGPLRHGWAARAGTPPTLRAPSVSSAGPAGAATRAASPQAEAGGPFAGRFSGTVKESRTGDGLVTVVVQGAASAVDGRLHLALRGTPLAGGGVAMDTSAVGFARGPDAYTGRIVALEGNRVGVRLRDSAGHALDLDLRLRIDAATGTVGGVLHGGPPGSLGESE